MCFPPSEPVQVYVVSPITYNMTNLTITGFISGIPTTSYANTTSSGTFSSLYIVPLLPPGTYKLLVNVSGALSSNNVSLTIPKPSVSLSATSGYEGMNVTFTGQNFANFTLGYMLNITFNSILIPQYIGTIVPTEGAFNYTGYSNGTVVGWFVVPVISPGTYTMLFNSTYVTTKAPSGAEVGTNNTLYTTASFTVQPSYITVMPTPAVAGQQILITGYNFYPIPQ